MDSKRGEECRRVGVVVYCLLFVWLWYGGCKFPPTHVTSLLTSLLFCPEYAMWTRSPLTLISLSLSPHSCHSPVSTLGSAFRSRPFFSLSVVYCRQHPGKTHRQLQLLYGFYRDHSSAVYGLLQAASRKAHHQMRRLVGPIVAHPSSAPWSCPFFLLPVVCCMQ